MANYPFIADSSIPGLGASDLARLIGGTYVMGMNTYSKPARPAKQPLLKRALQGLLRRNA